MSERGMKSKLESMQQTIKFFETVLRASGDGIVITDATQNIVMVSDAFAGFFGQRWRDVVETNLFVWLDQLDGDALMRWAELEQRVHLEGDCRDVLFQIPRKSVAGTECKVRHLSVNAFPVERVADEEAGVIISIWRDVTEQVRVNEALRASAERFRTVADFAYDWEYWLDPAGNFIYVSPSCERITGYRADEFVQDVGLLQRIIHPDDQGEFAGHKHVTTKTGEILPVNFRIIDRGGGERWIGHICQPVYGDDGRYLGQRASNRDITERKWMEDALRANEVRFRTVADFTYNWEYWLDPAGNYVYVSPSCERITGYHSAEFVWNPKLLEDIIHPGDLEAFTNHEHTAVETGEILEIDFRIITRDGEERWISHICQPVHDDDGRYMGQRASNRDITERVRTEAMRRRMEDALLLERDRLNSILDAMPDGICIVNQQYDIQYTNPVIESEFGRINNRKCYEYFHDLDEVCPWCKNAEVFAGESVHWEQYFSKNNKHYELFDTLFVSQDASICKFQVFHDITARKQAIEAAVKAKHAAESANQAKSIFLSNMSHELRTPLNAILGFAQLMARAPLDTPLHTQRDNLDIINRSGQHLLALINDVLTLSKIEAGRMTLDASSFDLCRMLDGIVVMFDAQARNKGLFLELEYAADAPRYMRTDEGKLRQVLVNLLSNALKFTIEGGVVLRVKVKDRDRDRDRDRDHSLSLVSIVFEVQDTGSGIASAEMDVLFDAFVQTASGRKSHAGTGLGLPISRQFVQVMGGDMTVSSEAGKGSTFAFGIPVEEVDPSAIHTGAVAQDKVQGRVVGLAPDQPAPDEPYRILVVEDNTQSRLLVLKLLQPLGFEVRAAVNGKEGVDMHASWQPHLILTDMRMPVMDGYEAVRRIRSAEAVKLAAGEQKFPIPIIALTASSMGLDEAQITDIGCDDLIRKPFQYSVMFEKLTQYLGVRFAYAEQVDAVDEIQAVDDALLSEQIAALSPEWRARLNLAASAGDRRKTRAVIEQIREQEPGPARANLADALIRLTDDLRFDTLIELTELEEDET